MKTVKFLPLTVLVAAKNEALNLPQCLATLAPAARVILLDSRSTDQTLRIAEQFGCETVQFDYQGGYPKKRQWALDTLQFNTPWILLLDADESVSEPLWQEMARAIADPEAPDAFLITKGFHFLGRKFRFGGFSHSAVLLFRQGRARFERIELETITALDMEVHERLIVQGPIGRLRTPLVHQDFKGLHAYIARHNEYSTWEAHTRSRFLAQGSFGQETIPARLFGNTQERRRFLKKVALRIPGEPACWFIYHYLLRLGFLEARPGFIAARLRAAYIAQVRAKLYELAWTRHRFQRPKCQDHSASSPWPQDPPARASQ